MTSLVQLNVNEEINKTVNDIVEKYLSGRNIVKVIARPGYGKSFIAINVFKRLVESGLVRYGIVITQNNAQVGHWVKILESVGIDHIVLFGRSGNILGKQHSCNLGFDPSSPTIPCNRIVKKYFRVVSLKDDVTGRSIVVRLPCRHSATWVREDLSTRRIELERHGLTCVTYRDSWGSTWSFVYPIEQELCSYYRTFLELYHKASSSSNNFIIITNSKMFMLHYRFNHIPFPEEPEKLLIIFDEYDVTAIETPTRRFPLTMIVEALRRLSQILSELASEASSDPTFSSVVDICKDLQSQIDEALGIVSWLRRHIGRKIRSAIERDLARLRDILHQVTHDCLQLLENFLDMLNIDVYEETIYTLYQLHNTIRMATDLMLEVDDYGNTINIAIVGKPWSPIKELGKKHYILLLSATELPSVFEEEAFGNCEKIVLERKLPGKVQLVRSFTLPFTYRNYLRYRSLYVKTLREIVEEVFSRGEPTLIFAKSPKYVQPILSLVYDYCDWVDRRKIVDFIERKIPILVTCSLDRALDLTFVENLIITVDLLPNISSAEFRMLEKLYKKQIVIDYLHELADNTLYQLLGRFLRSSNSKVLRIYSPDLRVAWRIARLVRKGLIEAVPCPIFRKMMELAYRIDINWNNIIYELLRRDKEVEEESNPNDDSQDPESNSETSLG